MKRVGNIWETFCSVENATRAIYRGTENKRTDRAVVRIFGYDGSARCGELNPRKVDCYAKRIVAELEEGRWHHQPGRARTIQSSGKTRNIKIARLHDHIVQWMAMLAIEDMLIKRMYRTPAAICRSEASKMPEKPFRSGHAPEIASIL